MLDLNTYKDVDMESVGSVSVHVLNCWPQARIEPAVIATSGSGDSVSTYSKRF